MEDKNGLTLNVSISNLTINSNSNNHTCGGDFGDEGFVEPSSAKPGSQAELLANLSPEQKLILTRMWGGLQPLQLATLVDQRLMQTGASVMNAAPAELLTAAQTALDTLRKTEQADLMRLHALDLVSCILFVLDKRGLLGLDSLFVDSKGQTKQ